MTLAEQDQCVGMWFELEWADYLVILASPDDPYDGYATVMIPHPIKAKTTYTKMSTLTPRWDLPRAWTPTGEPVPGDCEYAAGHVVEYADGQKDCRPRYREDSRQSALTSAEELKDDGYVAMRRFVTDWEEA